MDWRPRLYWALLAIAVGIAGAVLTRWVTHVDRGPRPHVGVAFDETRPFEFDRLRATLNAVEADRFRVPRLVMADPGVVLFIVTPMTRAISVTGVAPREISCAYLDGVERRASAADWVERVRGARLAALDVQRADTRVRIQVPARLRTLLARPPSGQGAIRCVLSRPFAAPSTFTDRTLTLRAENGAKGAVILDVSALDAINDLRFSGGVAIPFAGDRARLLDKDDSVVSADWSDVVAQEERDIVLVTIGALAAIGAAMAIEAIRPFVEPEIRK